MESVSEGVASLIVTASSCPFEDPDHADPYASEEPCPHHRLVHRMTAPGDGEKPVKVERLYIVDSHFTASGQSELLLRRIGGGDRVRQMVTRFYAHAFRDGTLRKFLFAGDSAAAHGDRLGSWLVEKWGGEGTPWADAGRTGLRAVSHNKAWHSRRRAERERGVRFKQDDCRIWMRLMFLSGREVGLDHFPDFWHFYLLFVRHFIGVYERSAQRFARESMDWSADPDNVAKYKADGFQMKDVMGVGRK